MVILDQFKDFPTVEIETKDGLIILYGRSELTPEEEKSIKDAFKLFSRKQVCDAFKESGFTEYRVDRLWTT